jgi:2'-5' RNA ligase
MRAGYRYFLGFRPDPILRAWLASLGAAAGQIEKRVAAEYLHLTLCVIAEGDDRDPFILARVTAALAGEALASCPIRLGRVIGGAGAAIHTLGRQEEIQGFYRVLIARLASRDLFPLHRRSGLNPHVTLGYDRGPDVRYKRPREWIPTQLFLIESEVGQGRHNILGRWPLLPPPQGFFPFAAPDRLAA